jgi:hypothetical protein
MSLVSVFDRIRAQTGERVEGLKTGETAESPVFMGLFAHVKENTKLRGTDLLSIPPSPPFWSLLIFMRLSGLFWTLQAGNPQVFHSLGADKVNPNRSDS